MNQDQFSFPILKSDTVDPVLDVKKQKDSVLITTDSIISRKHDTIVEPVKDSLFVEPLTDSAFVEPVIALTQEVENPVIPISSLDSNYQKSSWFIGILVIILILISKIKISFPRLTPSVLQSYFRLSETNKLYKSKNKRNTVCYTYMNILSTITLSVFIFELGMYYSFFKGTSPKLLMFITGVLLIFISFKIFLAKILGFIFRSNDSAREYSFNLLLICKTLGIVLIPFVLSIPFVNFSSISYFLTLGVSIVGISYILVILRGIKILFTKHVSFLYMILYLCALEMVPLVIAYKYIMNL